MNEKKDSKIETDIEINDGSSVSTPLWVKVFGVVAIALVILFIIMHLTGNSPGGPGGH